MSLPRVSVILTTYNSQKTIGPVLESILGQSGSGTEFELELLAVDDGSVDETCSILQAYGIAPRSTGANSGGPNKGRNIGLAAATGQAICIADHDDVWEPDRIRHTLPHLQTVPIVTCGYTIHDRVTGKQVRKVAGEPLVRYAAGVTFLDKLSRSKKGQNTYLGSILYRAELSGIRFEERHGMLDYDWILRLFENRESLEVGRSLYRRVVEGANLSLDPRYRELDFEGTLEAIRSRAADHPKQARLGIRRAYGSYGRYWYLMGRMSLARRHFLKAGLSPVNLAYLATSFAGSKWVRKRFNVFG